MNFHLGKPILVMLIIALVAGAVVAVRPEQEKADITVWVFADSHYKAYKPLIPEFERKHNVKVNLNILNARALAVRLTSLFMAGDRSDETPDLVEMEISLMGRFFRPPVKDVGFLPLNDRLKATGLLDQIVPTRFAPWSKEGVIFGVPHDLHPCVIVYREDLFREAGIDLTQAKTWPQYHEACLKFTKYWRGRGYPHRHALELPESSSDYLQAMLLQRGINPIDSYGNINLEDPRVAQTLAFYAQLVAHGPKKVTQQTSQGIGAFTKDLTEGSLCSFIAPDWRVTYIKRYGAAVSGKMRMMPMPVFEPTDRPTSTWGGTMMGITRACKNPDLAWKLMEHLYFSEAGMKARQESTEILPPITTMWGDPFYHTPDPYFGGQKASELFIELAPKIPPRYVTFASPVATLALNDALVRATNHVEEHGEKGLEENCRKWLANSARDLKARMDQWRFD